LTLTDEQVDELVTSIAEESDSSSIMVVLARSVKKGLAVRGEEDSDDDDWNPGDFGHPLNADGSPRQAKRIEGYCVSCKELRVFDGFIRIAESGNSLVNGACPVCNTRMSKTV
jgi:O-methyltransferase involved in polyketide biosynthesis